MAKRLIGVPVLVLAMMLWLLAPAALAVEAQEGPEEPPPDIEEICAQDRPSAEFCPDDYVEPSFFQWMLFPLLGLGILMTAGIVFAYLVWQPRFAEERRQKQRR